MNEAMAIRRQPDHGTNVRKHSWYWVSAGRQMFHDHGGQTTQVLWGVMLLTMTLFLGVVAIAEVLHMSLTVVPGDGLSFRQVIGLQQALRETLSTAQFYTRDPEYKYLAPNSTESLHKIVDVIGPTSKPTGLEIVHNDPRTSDPEYNSLAPNSTGSLHKIVDVTGPTSKPTGLEIVHNDPGTSDPEYNSLAPNSTGSLHKIVDVTGPTSKPTGPEIVHTDPGAIQMILNAPLAHDDAGVADDASTTAVLQLETGPSEGSEPEPPLVNNVVCRAEEAPGWVEFPYYSNGDETEQIMSQIRENGTLPCHEIRTQKAQVLGFPLEGQQQHPKSIRLAAGPIHELLIVSIGEDGQPRCAGGDYYETDLSGPRWKSRPPVLDLKNGTYSVHLQMDPRFAGNYTFKVVLLFANFHGLHRHTKTFARMEEIVTLEVEFIVPPYKPKIKIDRGGAGHSGAVTSSPIQAVVAANDVELPMCRRQDFDKKYWSGRWTREMANGDCEYDRYGRWQCVDAKLQCQQPWCDGPVGSLESNGWVYSAHCAFKIFQKEEAWKCLDGKWLFFWGDSNHIDTIRNLLNFVLGFDHNITFLPRRMDTTYFSPPYNQSSVRITSMFNGHSNVTMNYEGLFSLHDQQFSDQLRSFFVDDTAPDFMIMNSGLHDGVYWHDVEEFLKEGAEVAAEFWTDVWNNMRARRPDLLFRTTVATGGNYRNLSMNPHKMEVFNHLLLDSFFKLKLERFQIIDGFDYTFPWHWDHKTNDGVHYGRPPSKSRWTGDNIGHKYFVDVMLVHMLLNAICPHDS